MNLRICLTVCWMAASGLLAGQSPVAAQAPRHAAQVTTNPNVSPDHPPHGRPENRWRYQFHRGTWWYRTAENAWAYWNGDLWVPYTDQPVSAGPAPGSQLGPIAGPVGLQGVFIRGPQSGLIRVGDRAATKMLPRGTVMPRFLRGEFTENPERQTPKAIDEEPKPADE